MDGESLCVLYGFQDDVICDENSVWGDQPIRDATAHLIAAAPEMYKALKSCLRFIENTECEIGEELMSGDLARAALAKAEGRS